jgi:hypothetical protein
MKLINSKASVLEINTLEDLNNYPIICAIAVDYIIINSNIKDEFLNSKLRLCVLPMLNQTGRLIYY